MRRTPVAQSRRPFLGPADVEDLLTGLDHAAVDDSGRDRGHLTRRHGHHGLVEQAQSCLSLSQADERPSPGLEGHHHELVVGVRCADPGSFLKRGARACVIASLVELEPDRDQEPPKLGTLVPGLLEHSPGASEPPACLGILASAVQGDAEPECAPRRPRPVVPIERGMMRASPDFFALSLAAGQVCRRGQPFEIVELERNLEVRGRKLSIGIPPRLPVEGSPASLEQVHGAHQLASAV